MTVGEENILPPIVVKIEKSRAESQILPVDAEAGGQAGVMKRAVSVIPVQRGYLIGEVSPDNVEPAIPIVIANSDAHAGHRRAIPVERRPGRHSDFAEGAVVIVVIEQAGGGVAGHIDIGPTVVIEISRHGTHSVRAHRTPVFRHKLRRRRPAWMGYPGLLRHVFKGTVAPVSIEHVGSARESLRPTRNGNFVEAAIGRFSRTWGSRRVEVHVVAHEKIQMAIAVVVEKATARPPLPSRSRNARLLGYVGESSVAVIAVENVAAPVANEQVVESIIVEVANAATLAPSRMRESSLPGDVGEGAVAVVAEQIARRLCRSLGALKVRAIHQEDVQPAIVVVIEQGDAGTHFFHQKSFVRWRAGDIPSPAESGFESDVGKVD